MGLRVVALLLELFDHVIEIRISGAKAPGEPVSTASGDHVAVRYHIELPDLAGCSHGINIKALLNEGHETRDLGFVVRSDWTVNDLDLHAFLRLCFQLQTISLFLRVT